MEITELSIKELKDTKKETEYNNKKYLVYVEVNKNYHNKFKLLVFVEEGKLINYYTDTEICFTYDLNSTNTIVYKLSNYTNEEINTENIVKIIRSISDK